MDAKGTFSKRSSQRRTLSFLEKRKKIYVAGHTEGLGQVILESLEQQGATQLITATPKELDLCDEAATEAFFAKQKPDYVFMTASQKNNQKTHPVACLTENLRMITHLLSAAHRHQVKRLLWTVSASVYPQHAPQPMRESHVMEGFPPRKNSPYAMAARTGIALSEAYRTQYGVPYFPIICPSYYGPKGCSYEAQVLGTLLARMHEAKQTKASCVDISVEAVTAGEEKHSFMHVEDCATACLLAMDQWELTPRTFPAFLNIGGSEDLSLAALGRLIKKIVGYTGRLIIPSLQQERTEIKRKWGRKMDGARLKALGFSTKVSLERGIKGMYEAQYLSQDKQPLANKTKEKTKEA